MICTGSISRQSGRSSVLPIGLLNFVVAATFKLTDDLLISGSFRSYFLYPFLLFLGYDSMSSNVGFFVFGSKNGPSYDKLMPYFSL